MADAHNLIGIYQLIERLMLVPFFLMKNVWKAQKENRDEYISSRNDDGKIA